MRRVVALEVGLGWALREDIGKEFELDSGDQRLTHLWIVGRQTDIEPALHHQLFVDHILENSLPLCGRRVCIALGVLRLDLSGEIAAQDGTLIDERDGLGGHGAAARALRREQAIACEQQTAQGTHGEQRQRAMRVGQLERRSHREALRRRVPAARSCEATYR